MACIVAWSYILLQEFILIPHCLINKENVIILREVRKLKFPGIFVSVNHRLRMFLCRAYIIWDKTRCNSIMQKRSSLKPIAPRFKTKLFTFVQQQQKYVKAYAAFSETQYYKLSNEATSHLLYLGFYRVLICFLNWFTLTVNSYFQVWNYRSLALRCSGVYCQILSWSCCVSISCFSCYLPILIYQSFLHKNSIWFFWWI